MARYYTGNPSEHSSKEFFTKDRYIQYVSSEASGVIEDDDDELMPFYQQSMIPETPSVKPSLYQPIGTTETPSVKPSLYQPTETPSVKPSLYQQSMIPETPSVKPSIYQPYYSPQYQITNALYNSLNLLDELNGAAAAPASAAASPARPSAAAASPARPSAAAASPARPSAAPASATAASPARPSAAAAPARPSAAPARPGAAAAAPARPAVDSAIVGLLEQAEVDEKNCSKVPLEQVTIDGKVCKGSCSKGLGRVLNPETGDIADWCYTTENSWGICNPFELTNSCTSKNLYTLSKLEEYMDSKEYNDTIRGIENTDKSVFDVLHKVAQKIQGAFCNITAQKFPPQDTLMYRLCDANNNVNYVDKMYTRIMPDIENKIQPQIRLLEKTNFFNIIKTTFPIKDISKKVWAIALYLLPITPEEFYRLIVKRYARVNKSTDGINWKKILAIVLGVGAAVGVGAAALSAYSAPQAPGTSVAAAASTGGIPEATAPQAGPAATAFTAPPTGASAVDTGLAKDVNVSPAGGPPIDFTQYLDVAKEAQAAAAELGVAAAVGTGAVVPELEEAAGVGEDVEEAFFEADLESIEKILGETSTSVSQQANNPSTTPVTMEQAVSISNSVKQDTYLDILNDLPISIAIENTISLQIAVAQTASYNSMTNPRASQEIAKSLSKVTSASDKQQTNVWVENLFKALEKCKSDTALASVMTVADVCEAASTLHERLPYTDKPSSLLPACNVLTTELTVNPRVTENVNRALNSLHTDTREEVQTITLYLPALCNLVTKFPAYIHVNNVVQYLLSVSQQHSSEPVQLAMNKVALVRTKSTEPPSPVFVPQLAELDVSRPISSFSTQLSTMAVKSTSFVLSSATALAAFGAFAPLGVYRLIEYYLTSPAVVAAASTPTMVPRVNRMNNPYCTYLSRWDTRLCQALESNDSTEQLLYNETEETCSMLYSLLGTKAPPGATVADAISEVQAKLPAEVDYGLQATAFQAHATFITNITNTNNPDMIGGAKALLESSVQDQAAKLAALQTLVFEKGDADIQTSFTKWQTAQTIFVDAHPNGMLTRNMITPILEVYDYFSRSLESKPADESTLEASAVLNRTIVDTARTVIDKAQELFKPPNASLSGLMPSELPARPFTFNDLSKPNWLQLTCNLASKNMTDTTNGPLAIDVLPPKIVPNPNSPWTLVPRISAFIGVARMGGALTWANATCNADGSLTMTKTVPPTTTEKAATFMEQCPMVVEENVPAISWNVTADFTIDKPEALKQDIGKEPTCVFVPYSWALPSNSKLSPEAIQFFEKVYSHITFEFDDKPLAFAMSNTAAPLVASSGIGSISSALSDVAGVALVYIMRELTDTAHLPWPSAAPQQTILEKRRAELNQAMQELRKGSDEIKGTEQFDKTRDWIVQEDKYAIEQIQSAKAQLARMVGGGPMARVQVLL